MSISAFEYTGTFFCYFEASVTQFGLIYPAQAHKVFDLVSKTRSLLAEKQQQPFSQTKAKMQAELLFTALCHHVPQRCKLLPLPSSRTVHDWRAHRPDMPRRSGPPGLTARDLFCLDSYMFPVILHVLLFIIIIIRKNLKRGHYVRTHIATRVSTSMCGFSQWLDHPATSNRYRYAQPDRIKSVRL